MLSVPREMEGEVEEEGEGAEPIPLVGHCLRTHRSICLRLDQLLLYPQRGLRSPLGPVSQLGPRSQPVSRVPLLLALVLLVLFKPVTPSIRLSRLRRQTTARLTPTIRAIGIRECHSFIMAPGTALAPDLSL